MNKRYAYLDGIRGVAAIFILLRHTVGYWGFEVYRSYLAVDLFFILSGFVIAESYAGRLARRDITIGQFVKLRLIRVYPVYLASLCIAMPAFILSSPGADLLGVNDFISVGVLSLLFLPSLPSMAGSLYPVNGPYWSLFFELIVNFLYAVGRPLLKPKVLGILLTAAGAGLFLAASEVGNLDSGFRWGGISVITGFLRAAFGILMGVYISRKLESGRFPQSPILAMLMIFLMFFVPALGAVDFLVDVLSVFLVFPACLILCATTKADRLSRWLVLLGLASYPIYVFHKPIGELVYFLAPNTIVLNQPYFGVLLVIVLVLSSIVLEKKIDGPIRKVLVRKVIGKAS
ncbi:acyltransferase [Halioxenophilus sp. WMMB6]|uniref:acyltransferase family protein n=1 Tax=Halioxenophilus sp. WMMB6 TaxID=3073815 RepID=UPI00295E30B8|nr:acyltransferase [Halioxenophilus sp. WMMB6]